MDSIAMSSLSDSNNSPPIDGAAALRRVLGFNNEDDGRSFEPYLQYIQDSSPGRDIEDSLRLFNDVVTHFKNLYNSNDPGCRSIQRYINTTVSDGSHYYFNDTIAGSAERKTSVTDTIFLVLGTWLLMQEYFVPSRGDQRRIVFAYCWQSKEGYSEDKALAESLPRLLSTGGLLPNPDEPQEIEGNDVLEPDISCSELSAPFGLHASVGLLESLSIEPVNLNAFRLSMLARVHILWTENISRHLLLSKHGETYYLELFALPCALHGGAEEALTKVGISADLIEEVEASYANLFNPKKHSYVHRYLGRIVGLRYWCWCLSCASHRLKNTEIRRRKETSSKNSKDRPGLPGRTRYDPRLEELMERDASPWDQTEFRNLWPRVLTLDAHLQQARPWKLWVLFRDRRDTVQYWTFLFGSIILILTIVQVVLSAVQVAGSFAGGNNSNPTIQ